MDITRDYIDKVIVAAKAYDVETDILKRHQLGQTLDQLANPLSEGQVRQLLKIMASRQVAKP